MVLEKKQQDVTRRKFLRAGYLTAAAVAVGEGLLALAPLVGATYQKFKFFDETKDLELFKKEIQQLKSGQPEIILKRLKRELERQEEKEVKDLDIIKVLKEKIKHIESI